MFLFDEKNRSLILPVPAARNKGLRHPLVRAVGVFCLDATLLRCSAFGFLIS